MTPTPALDAMRAKTREQDEAATPRDYVIDIDGWPVWFPEEGRGSLPYWAEDIDESEGNPYRPYRISFAALSAIAAFRTDAPRYAAMLGVAVDALKATVETAEDDATGWHEVFSIARAALAEIEEMARESR